jgi:hypothetical protein
MYSIKNRHINLLKPPQKSHRPAWIRIRNTNTGSYRVRGVVRKVLIDTCYFLYINAGSGSSGFFDKMFIKVVGQELLSNYIK